MDTVCDPLLENRPAQPKPIAVATQAVRADSLKAVARFAFVDGLRGLAALSIMIFHIWMYEPDPRPTLADTPWMLEAAFRSARGGVHMLLVISGFVIAYTLRKTRVDLHEIVSFLVRRFVRLAPAYWLALAIVIMVEVFCTQWADLPSPFEDELSVARVVAHMAFVQDVAGQKALSAGVWTLCIEMQFYLVAILTWGVAQRLFPRKESQTSSWGLFVLLAPIAIVSLFFWRPLESTEPWITHFLWMFFLGMVTWWTLDRSLSPIALYLLVGVAVAELAINSEWRFANSVSLCTAVAIYIAGRTQKMHVWLSWSPLQYFGKVSYSVYLIHFPVSHLVTSLGWKFFNYDPTSGQATFVLLASVALSLVAGHLMYVFVEAPSARWSTRLKEASILSHTPSRSVLAT